MKKNINIQKKLINHLIKNGKKKTSETILLKSLKKLQKNSFKKSKKIFQLALIHLTPIFKLHKISPKKLK
jgi:ribosomal protein S7